MKKIVLKSSSPRRFELLTKMGYEFEVKVFDVDETLDNNLTPFENVKALGLKKALAGKEYFKDYIQIGCDTIVVFEDKIYGKPHSEEDAYNMLKSLSGKMHYVMSGLGVIYKDKVFNDVEVSKVYFKELADEEIWDYINTKEPFGKAGSYAIQGIGNKLVDRYEGSLNNIIGLPTEMLEKILGDLENESK